jgi:hypothetical protein
MTTEQEMVPTNEAPLAAYDSAEAVSVPDDSGRSSLRFELRRLGELLARALRAAAGTREAEELKAELRDGMDALKREMDTAVESTRGATDRVRETGGPTADKVRVEVADALRSINKALDKLATGVEPTKTDGPDSGTAA